MLSCQIIHTRRIPFTKDAKEFRVHEPLGKAIKDSLLQCITVQRRKIEVQKRAAVSRGALLHHFQTHALLLSATVERLVWMNEQAVLYEAGALSNIAEPIERAISVFCECICSSVLCR